MLNKKELEKLLISHDITGSKISNEELERILKEIGINEFY